MKAYGRRAKAWKLERPRCLAVIPEAICLLWTRDMHHTKGRGPFLMDETTWLPVCRHCHDYIHNHANWAREKGFLK